MNWSLNHLSTHGLSLFREKLNIFKDFCRTAVGPGHLKFCMTHCVGPEGYAKNEQNRRGEGVTFDSSFEIHLNWNVGRIRLLLIWKYIFWKTLHKNVHQKNILNYSWKLIWQINKPVSQMILPQSSSATSFLMRFFLAIFLQEARVGLPATQTFCFFWFWIHKK